MSIHEGNLFQRVKAHIKAEFDDAMQEVYGVGHDETVKKLTDPQGSYLRIHKTFGIGSYHINSEHCGIDTGGKDIVVKDCYCYVSDNDNVLRYYVATKCTFWGRKYIVLCDVSGEKIGKVYAYGHRDGSDYFERNIDKCKIEYRGEVIGRIKKYYSGKVYRESKWNDAHDKKMHSLRKFSVIEGNVTLRQEGYTKLKAMYKGKAIAIAHSVYEGISKSKQEDYIVDVLDPKNQDIAILMLTAEGLLP